MKKLLLLPLLCSNLCIAQIVALDVGHSSRDPGATSAYGDSEFSYNQAMGLTIANSIGRSGIKVNLIGYNGDITKLEQRSQLAQNSNLFVSVHHDSVHEQDLKYWEYNGKRLRFNDNVKGFGIFVSTKNPYFHQSLICANKVANKLISYGFTPNYYHNITPYGRHRELFSKSLPVYKYDNLIVLKTATIPAILIESGVIINREEAKWIAQEDVREAFAKAVSEAINQCFRDL
jgi:N-acetylmuramoyl-L-alanine amidase